MSEIADAIMQALGQQPTDDDNYLGQAQAIADRKRMLADQVAQQQGLPQGQMVSGYYVKPSIGQYVAPILGNVVNTATQAGISRDSATLSKVSAAAAAAYMQTKPEDTAPLADKLAWAQKGAQIPQLTDTLNKYVADQLTNEPDRAAARADKMTLAQQQIAAQAAKDEADRKSRESIAAGQQQTSRDNAQLMAAAMGGRQNQMIQASDGTWYSANKPGGTATPVVDSSTGQPLTKVDPATKTRQYNNAQMQTNAATGLKIMDDVDNTLSGKNGPTPTSSGAGSIRDNLMAQFGMASDGAVANAPIKKLSAWLASITPTGNTKTDFARQQAIQATGALDDPTTPLAVKRAAAKAVRESIQVMADPSSYADPVTRTPGSPPSMGGGSGSTVVKTKADYDALPSGATYTDPNGNTRTKR